MLYKTHITTGYTVASGLSLLTGVYNPLVFLAVPLFSLLADSDHNKGMVAQTLGLKFGFLGHRGILHSGLGLLILNIIFISIFMGILFLLGIDMSVYNFLNADNGLDTILGTGTGVTAFSVITMSSILFTVVLLILGIMYNILGKVLYKFLGKGISNFVLNIISIFLFFGFLFFLGILYKITANSPLINIFIGFYILLISHLVGDYFTNTGFPFFYPFSKRRIKAPITFSTGKSFEKLLLIILTVVNIFMLIKIMNNIDINSNIIHFSTPVLTITTIIFIITFILLFGSDLNIGKQIKKIFNNFKGIIKVIVSMIIGVIIFSAGILGVIYAYLSSNIQTSTNTILLGIGSLIGLFVLLHFVYKKFVKSYSYLYFITVSALFIYIVIYSIIGIMINGYF